MVSNLLKESALGKSWSPVPCCNATVQRTRGISSLNELIKLLRGYLLAIAYKSETDRIESDTINFQMIG